MGSMAKHRPSLRIDRLMFFDAQTAAGYVAAMIDGEGSVSCTPKHRGIRVGNTDMALLDAYEEALGILGVQYTRIQKKRRPPWKDMAVTSIFGRRNLETILRDVPIRAPEKRRRLKVAVDSFVMPNYYRKHEVTRERLLELVERGLTQREIAAALGLKSHSNAQHHLEKHGLRTLRGRKACGLL
jgi:hypothetical protein